MDYPKGVAKSLAEVSYKDLRSGSITINGKKSSHRTSFQLLQSPTNSQSLKRMDRKRQVLFSENRSKFYLPSLI